MDADKVKWELSIKSIASINLMSLFQMEEVAALSGAPAQLIVVLTAQVLQSNFTTCIQRDAD